ncbi:hypothetical protein CJF30_00009973 [Rutstroemia sp. NJR-2017a BBW]|nr:hypothetical protein CJF30_00009973 [Rutstroemia sp. NJR-2017a BBW]
MLDYSEVGGEGIKGYNSYLFASYIRYLNISFDLVETYHQLKDNLKYFEYITNFIEKYLNFKICYITLDSERTL